MWSNGSRKTHVRKIQGSDSKVFGTASDPNPVANRGRGRPIACQGFVRVINVVFESKKSWLVCGDVGKLVLTVTAELTIKQCTNNNTEKRKKAEISMSF